MYAKTILSQNKRRGFTLVEMLMVIFIILILASLIAGGLFAAIGAAKRRATQARVQTVADAVVERIEAFRYETEKSSFTPDTDGTGNLNRDTIAQNDLARAKLVWKMDLYRSEFPQEFDDFLFDAYTDSGRVKVSGGKNSPWSPIRERYIAYFNKNFIPANHKTSTQSAACLYMILKFNNRGGMSFNFDNGLGPAAVMDTDGDGLLEIVDPYSTIDDPRPLRFYRWPTDLLMHLASKSTDGTVRQKEYPVGSGTFVWTSEIGSNLDPFGSLYNASWFSLPAGGVAFENINAASTSNYTTLVAPATFIAGSTNPANQFNADSSASMVAPYPGPRHRYFRLHQPYSDPTDLTSAPLPNVAFPMPLVPVVMSAGPDGDFGMYEQVSGTPGVEPTALGIRCGRVDPAKVRQFEDNIMSFKIKSVGI